MRQLTCAETTYRSSLPRLWRWTCPACAAPRATTALEEGDVSIGIPWHYALVRCPDCAMGRVTPEPSEKVLSAIYSNEYAAYQAKWDATRQCWTRRAKMAVAGLAAHAHRDGVAERAVA